jgi:uncharacterized protein
VVAFFQAKFYLLFSFLFGYSAHLILGRGDRTGQFVMRLFGLGLLGISHALVFFVGDILLTYAILGAVLVFAWRWSDRALLRASLIAAFIAVAWMMVVGYVSLQEDLDNAETLQLFVRTDELLKTGSFWQTVQARFEIWPMILWVLGSLNWGLVMACFFLGMLAGRKQMLAQPEKHPLVWAKCRRAAWIGLPLSLISAWMVAGVGSQGGLGSDPRSLTGVLLGFCSAPFLSAAYVGWMIKLRSFRSNVFAFFRSAGRMSLTLYIAESVLLASYFCGWGAGYFGTLGGGQVLLIAILAWLCLEVVAMFWLRFFAQGPLELVLKRWSGLIGKLRRSEART